MKLKILLSVFYLCSLSVAGQNRFTSDNPAYPKNYFRNPLSIPIILAGNFGECRPAHFHSGIDIKTNGHENQPVYAAADGYISRMKTESGGFGHALYITHPNGYTTLYAHLNNYAPALQRFLRKQQYKQEHWNVDIALSPDQFPVHKGQQIAWSGNTGASTAPHLHFEIRNTKTEHPLNPELFGLPIIDNQPPVPLQIAVYDLSRSIYEESPVLKKLKKTGMLYKPQEDTITTEGSLIGIGIVANDYMNGSHNKLAFYKAAVYIDDNMLCDVRLDDIGYDETRYVNAYEDYKTNEQKNITIQCLFKLPGNHLDHIYTYLNDKQGAFALADDRAHKCRVIITDDRGNKSTVVFYARYSRQAANGNSACATLFHADDVNNFDRPNVMFSLKAGDLYDDICFNFAVMPEAGAYSDRYQLHYGYVPVHRYFDLKIKSTPVPFELHDKIAMIYFDGHGQSGKAAIAADDGWYHADVRNFGDYWLAADTVPPVVTPLQKITGDMRSNKQITFMAKDQLTSVKTFVGTIDGKWVCFEQHNNLFFYKFDEHCPHGKHVLTIKATDENNNTRELHYYFTR